MDDRMRVLSVVHMDQPVDLFRRLGLTEREIAVLSRIYADGDSVRDAAEKMCCSRMTVQNDKTSGLKKLKLAGLELPEPVKGRKPKIRPMDGRVMGRLYTDADRYNAR
jgi:DNA-binding CsgD family transcriptional regulator